MEEEISNEEPITERIKWIRAKLAKSNPFRPDWKDLDWALHQLEREHERANRLQRLRRSYIKALEPMLGDETLTDCMTRLVQIALGNPEIAPMAALLKQARHELEEASKASYQHRKDRIAAESERDELRIKLDEALRALESVPGEGLCSVPTQSPEPA